jgi:UDP-N-acetylglucosamine 2-epimerase (non-hydrolysing)
MKILSVVGARPNFMKIAPFVRAIDQYNRSCSNEPIEHILLHTGQHYDVRMSEAFFRELGIPDPDISLGIGSGSHAEQLGHTMIEFEKALLQTLPDWVVVVGDINATLACSVIAKRLNINVCHIEAGLRSGDISMPEEVNRLVTDRLADLLLTPDRISSQNLRNEGTPESRIRFVGNIMIDTLEAHRPAASALSLPGIVSNNLLEGQTSKKPRTNGKQTAVFSGYAVATLHRPSNVDREEVLGPLLDFLSGEVADTMPVIWPVHPRAQKMLQSYGRWDKALACKNLFYSIPSDTTKCCG